MMRLVKKDEVPCYWLMMGNDLRTYNGGIGGILIYGKDKNKPIPFGPYLAIAGWIAFFWGEKLNQTYLQTMGMG